MVDRSLLDYDKIVKIIIKRQKGKFSIIMNCMSISNMFEVNLMLYKQESIFDVIIRALSLNTLVYNKFI